MPRIVRAASGALLFLSACCAFCAVVLIPRAASAAGGVAKWTEWHATGDDVKIVVDTSGVARIEHAVRYRVVMGPLKQIELNGLEKNLALAPDAIVASDDGHELAAHVEARIDPKSDAKGEAALRVVVDDPKGLKRGLYTFRLHYDVDLVAAKELVKDGAMWRLSWHSPTTTEGYDDARVVFHLPGAPTEPRRVKTGLVAQGQAQGTAEPDGATEGGEDGVVATLARTQEADELEMVRPHVGHGEAPLWAARVDPKAFPEVQTHALRPPPPPEPPEPNRLREGGVVIAIAALGLVFGMLVRSKMRAFALACARAGATPRPLVPLSPALLGALAGLAASGGALLQCAGFATPGALVMASAMALAVSRTPHVRRAPRGPGRWLAMPAREVLRGPLAGAPLRDGLDVGTGRGKLAAALACALTIALAAASRLLGPEAPFLVVMDALALVPLFVTGRAVQLPPDLARSPVPLLARTFTALKKDAALETAPWARVPLGGESPDEVRLLVLPRASLPGLLGIEVGVAWTRTATGYAPRPEVLVRVHDGSDAAARLPKFAPFARPVTGRRPDEKVARFSPAFPGRAALLALVQRLAREVTDRRVILGGAVWAGKERRDHGDTDKVPVAA